MKKFHIIIAILLTFSLTGCMESIKSDDFEESAISAVVNVAVSIPDGYEYSIAGLTVQLSDPSTGLTYNGVTNTQGVATVRVPFGTYTASTEMKKVAAGGTLYIFNGTTGKIRMSPKDAKEATVDLPLNVSKSGQIIIKEFYFGGCYDVVTAKSYSKDIYFILYNNSSEVAYLDSLCFGVAAPYNANTSGKLSGWVKPGTSELLEAAPLITFGWMFPGTGKDNPLLPGEQAIISLNAIDHSVAVSASVNLGKTGYWAAYNSVTTKGQTAPNAGVKLCENFWKNGSATSFVVSTSSPALFIFSLGGKTPAQFITDTYTDDPSSASTINDCLLVDKNLVLDGVECLRNITDTKRLRPEIDNGFTMIDGSGQGQSVHRVIDVAATANAGGRVVYMDTNNSSNDFVKISPVSLKK